MEFSKPHSNIAYEEFLFTKGLFIQREKFKMAKNGTGENNFDLMCDAVENIKSDIKAKVLKSGNKVAITKVEDAIKWYRTKEMQFSKTTEHGVELAYPPQISYLCNLKLTTAYERLIEQQHLLGLL